MAHIINLKTFTDRRGNLTTIDSVLPFDIKRVFYIYGVDDSERGGHRHHKTFQAVICIQGRCTIYNNDGLKEDVFNLDKPYKCLILKPQDWHKMYEFSKDAILMVLTSESFKEEDYIYKSYEN